MSLLIKLRNKNVVKSIILPWPTVTRTHGPRSVTEYCLVRALRALRLHVAPPTAQHTPWPPRHNCGACVERYHALTVLMDYE